MPPICFDDTIDWNTRENASKRRHQSIHTDHKVGILAIHTLQSDQLAEGVRNIEEETQQEAVDIKTNFGLDRLYHSKANPCDNRANSADHRTTHHERV